MSLSKIGMGMLACALMACGDKTDECMSNADCPDGETCVITHDHEGDDHDHGGNCEGSDTAGE